MIRVLVVDDDRMARIWVARMIESRSKMKVVGQARDGVQAVAMAEQLRPDVIVMDMAMPRANGLAATRHIMAHQPTPIVILSAAESRLGGPEAIDALRAGAVEAIEKPRVGEDQKRWTEHFLSTVRIAAGVRVIRHISGSLSPRRGKPVSSKPMELVVMGASTGGPKTVAGILGALPPLLTPILLVVHFPDSLFDPFADWLASVASMPVVVPQDGTPLASLAGSVCVAPPGRHLVVAGGHVATTDGPPEHFCKPSVDVLFKSAAESVGDRTLAVLLTGMGSDGAEGMLRIREAGGRTIAQDEATAIVSGMPKAAIELDAADEILPDREIADAILRLCGRTMCEVPR